MFFHPPLLNSEKPSKCYSPPSSTTSRDLTFFRTRNPPLSFHICSLWIYFRRFIICLIPIKFLKKMCFNRLINWMCFIVVIKWSVSNSNIEILIIVSWLCVFILLIIKIWFILIWICGIIPSRIKLWNCLPIFRFTKIILYFIIFNC